MNIAIYLVRVNKNLLLKNTVLITIIFKGIKNFDRAISS